MKTRTCANTYLHSSIRGWSSPFLLLSLFIISSCGSGTGDSDPISVDVAIAYVDRSLYTDDDVNEDGEQDPVIDDIESPRKFNGGAKLIVRNRTNQNAQLRDITSSLFPGQLYDVKDLSPSYDGKKLVFALRAPQIAMAEEDDQPTWNLWEYDVEDNTVSRLIVGDITADDGHDINPTYLPDNKTIVFSSSRQKTSKQILGREITAGADKQVFEALTDSRDEDNGDNLGIGEIFNLHTLDTETQTITQITFNQSHDLHPTVLSDGRIAFLRWDNYPRNNSKQSIYTVNPDGTNVSLLYGYHYQNPVSMESGDSENATFYDLTTLPNGKLLALLKLRDSSVFTDFDDDFEVENAVKKPFLGGDLITIDYQRFIDINQTTDSQTGISGAGQSAIYTDPIDISDRASLNGHINSAFPFNDGSDKLLISRTSCRLEVPGISEPVTCEGNSGIVGATQADPFYSLWVFDRSSGTVSFVESPDTGRMITDVVVLNDATRPEPIDNSIPELPDKTGILHIESIYDFDGVLNTVATGGASLAQLADPDNIAFDTGRARFLRVAKAVSIPDDEVYDFDEGLAFGIANNRGMREILGYVPIEPDGSIAVKIPADVAFEIDIVDENGQRLEEFPIHRQWLSLRPNEIRHCTGCHTAGSELPHGRRDAEAASINPGAPTEGATFPNTGTQYLSRLGWTMATAYAAQSLDSSIKLDADTSEAIIYQGARELSPDLIYEDEWPLVPDAAENISRRYASESASAVPIPDDERYIPLIPTNESCIINWDSDCRIIINYEEHIQLLWDKVREGDLTVSEDDPSEMVARNYACSTCHSNANGTRNPAGQLAIDNDVSNNPPPDAYDDLLRTDTYALISGLQYQRDVDNNIVYLQDDNGTPLDTTDDFPILDADGAQIPLLENSSGLTDPADLRIQRTNKYNELLYVVTDLNDVSDPDDDTLALDASNNPIPSTDSFIDVPGTNIPGRRMQAGNARDSNFFDMMSTAEADAEKFDHSRLFQDIPASDPSNESLMSPEELRLISEWLDIGAQYYNNPFDAPLD